MTYIPDDPFVAALQVLCAQTPGSYKSVADVIGANDQSLYQIITGVKLPSGNRKGVGPELRKKLTAHYPGWTALAGKPVVGVDGEEGAPSNAVFIKEYEIHLAAGNGTVVYDEVAEGAPKSYDINWLSSQGLTPEFLRRFKVKGGSMERTLFNEDTVLVNLKETTPQNDKVFALLVDGELRVKRLYTKIGGGLIIHSDNPDWVPRQEELTPEQVEASVRIIGRVRDKSGSGGL